MFPLPVAGFLFRPPFSGARAGAGTCFFHDRLEIVVVVRLVLTVTMRVVVAATGRLGLRHPGRPQHIMVALLISGPLSPEVFDDEAVNRSVCRDEFSRNDVFADMHHPHFEIQCPVPTRSFFGLKGAKIITKPYDN